MPDEQEKGKSAEEVFQNIQKLLQGGSKVAESVMGPSAPGTQSVPGTALPQLQPTISFNPGAAPGAPIQHAKPPGSMQMPQSGGESIGNFKDRTTTTNAGMVSLGNSLSGLFNAVGQKEHEKKAALAENYLMQINGLIASGDPEDRKKAMMLLEDPKIKKMLKTGLEYVPIEEEMPPEAVGVQTAVKKIQQKQGAGAQGNAQGAPRMQALLPQPSQTQKLQSAPQSSVMQALQQDPAKALQMMGVSTLSSAEQHASEFYEKGLGMSPSQAATLSSHEKVAGLKMYETIMKDAVRTEIDLYKAQMGYKGKVDTAAIMANAVKYRADMMASIKDKKGAAINAAAGAGVYEKFAAKYLEMAKGAKEPNGSPLTEEHRKQYEQKAEMYQKKAEEYLEQGSFEEMMNMFQKAVEGEDMTGDEAPN